MSHVHAGWLMEAIPKDSREYAVKQAIKVLKKLEFDTIAFRGISGALIAPIVAYEMNKEIGLIRKPKENSHSNYEYEGFTEAKRFIALDDFVCTGETMAETIRVFRLHNPEAKFIGAYFYNSSFSGLPGFRTPDSDPALFKKVTSFGVEL